MKEDLMSDDILVFNGIDGASGGYVTPVMTAEQLSRVAQGEPLDEDHLIDLRARHEQASTDHYGVKEGVDPLDLSQSGWGVIFAYEDEEKLPAIREALEPLLKLRKAQAGDLYREFAGVDAYRPNESKNKFLARHGMGPGPADPSRVPYYLLIVGSPETIPFRFQYQLDVQYAVGRIYFDNLEEYASYANSVVSAETGQVCLPRRATFFGVQNNGDRATELSAVNLVEPLAGLMARDQPGWEFQTLMREEATKARLEELLCAGDPPSLLFTASHGMGFPNGDPRQLPHQGALLCQDWPGPSEWKDHSSIPQDFYLAADDVGENARLQGLLSFHFACYGASTPRLDNFAKQAFKDTVEEIAPISFLAALPRRLISHPGGGALAVIGHVERAWGLSFMWKGAAQLAVFESTLKRLMEGHPVGSALEYFNERYAELSTMLSDQLEDVEFGAVPNARELAGLWTATNDARSYVIIGDPAVRLAVGGRESRDAKADLRARLESVQVAGPQSRAQGSGGLGLSEDSPPESFSVQDQLAGLEAALDELGEIVLKLRREFDTLREKLTEE